MAYTHYDWQTGEVIEDWKLNNMEEGIDEALKGKADYEALKPTIVTDNNKVEKLKPWLDDTYVQLGAGGYITQKEVLEILVDYVKTTEMYDVLKTYVSEEALESSLIKTSEDLLAEVKSELGNYNTKEELETILNDYITKSFLYNRLKYYVLAEDLGVYLENYLEVNKLLNTRITGDALLPRNVYTAKYINDTYPIINLKNTIDYNWSENDVLVLNDDTVLKTPTLNNISRDYYNNGGLITGKNLMQILFNTSTESQIESLRKASTYSGYWIDTNFASKQYTRNKYLDLGDIVSSGSLSSADTSKVANIGWYINNFYSKAETQSLYLPRGNVYSSKTEENIVDRPSDAVYSADYVDTVLEKADSLGYDVVDVNNLESEAKSDTPKLFLFCNKTATLESDGGSVSANKLTTGRWVIKKIESFITDTYRGNIVNNAYSTNYINKNFPTNTKLSNSINTAKTEILSEVDSTIDTKVSEATKDIIAKSDNASYTKAYATAYVNNTYARLDAYQMDATASTNDQTVYTTKATETLVDTKVEGVIDAILTGSW